MSGIDKLKMMYGNLYEENINGNIVLYRKHEKYKDKFSYPTELYKNVDEIAAWTCANDDELEIVYISAKLKRIGEGAFYNCKNLKEIIIFGDCYDKNEINEIHSNNFNDCDENGYKHCDNLAKFKERFNGEIGKHAFENCFDDSILIKNNSEDANREKFEKALAPAPFYENNEERIFLKILEGDEEGFFNISLLNYNMLKYDMSYFYLNAEERKDYYYRPYFYELVTEKVNDKCSKFAQEHLGDG